MFTICHNVSGTRVKASTQLCWTPSTRHLVDNFRHLYTNYKITSMPNVRNWNPAEDFYVFKFLIYRYDYYCI
jgi:hypothetical protein